MPTTDQAKLELEIRKLEEEVVRLRRENTRWGSAGARLAPIFSALTVLIAVASLAWNALSQTRRDSREFFQDRLTDMVAGGTPQQRASAVRTLFDYWGDRRFREPLRRVALVQLAADPDPDVRAAIVDEMISGGVDTSLVRMLAEQNRELQQAIERHQMYSVVQPVVVALPNPIESAFSADTLAAQRFRDLGWNIRALVQALNRMGTVPNVDLSGVTFSRPMVRKTDPPYLTAMESEALRPGLRFEGTILRGATLAGLRLRGLHLHDVDMDSALLAGTVLDSVAFSGNTSLQALRTEVISYVPSPHPGVRPEWRLPESFAARFRGGTIEVRRFCVRAADPLIFENVRIETTEPGGDVSSACLPIPQGELVSSRFPGGGPK